MLTDEQCDFLAGLAISDDPWLDFICDAGKAPVAQVKHYGHTREESIQAAQLIVAACHDAATWGTVIEAAKAGDAETWERTAHYLGQMWWGGDAEDVCRAIAAALKEGSDV
jgi:pyruvoyl-dependent arginine decarboxylase (PvlArgDC)